jgi:hypothetical protein
MDAVNLGFTSECFPLVLERATLHHIERWPEALAEMVRVSASHLVLQEPIDDLRSAAKRRTYAAQGLFLRLQAEVGYRHYRHLDREVLLAAVQRQAVLLDTMLEKSDAPVGFDEFFDLFPTFASRSIRESYWFEQLNELRSQFGGAPLCEDDMLTVLAAKAAPD